MSAVFRTQRDDVPAEQLDAEFNVLQAFHRDRTDTSWMALGACAAPGAVVDEKVFFPVGAVVTVVLDDGTTDVDEVEPDYPTDEAKAICGFCPVRDVCLSWALYNRAVGTWGGTSTYQREQLSRHRSRVRCPGCTSETIINDTIGRTQLCLGCGVSWPT